MEQFVIVSDNQTNELSIIDKLTRTVVSNVYRYEPIASSDSLDEAKRLKDHIEQIGIQAYFDEVIESTKEG